jgi:hypothetical protein
LEYHLLLARDLKLLKVTDYGELARQIRPNLDAFTTTFCASRSSLLSRSA